MNDRGMSRTGVTFAVATAICWLLFVIGMATFPRGATTVETYLAAAASPAIYLYTWGGVLGALLSIAVFVVFLSGFRGNTGQVLAVPIVFSIVGSAFLALGFMTDSGSHIYHFAPALAAESLQTATALLKPAQFAQDSIEVAWSVGSFLSYGGPVVWAAILILKSTSAPRWICWAGIIGGLAGFVWVLGFLPLGAPQIMAIILVFINVVAVTTWLLGLSLYLVRAK